MAEKYRVSVVITVEGNSMAALSRAISLATLAGHQLQEMTIYRQDDFPFPAGVSNAALNQFVPPEDAPNITPEELENETNEE